MRPRKASLHSTSHYFLEALNEIGIEYLFCNFGTDHAPIIEEVARWTREGKRGPRIIISPHENVAMHMAAGYTLMTGRGQGVVVHVDSGTANAALGMHNLCRNRIPVLLMAGLAPFTTFGELHGSRDTYVHFIQQPLDQGSLVRPYSKWEYTLLSGVTVKETLRRAHTVMHSDPQGPTYLMLPREVLTQEWPEDAIRSFPADRFGPVESSGADPSVITTLASRILEANNPLLITSYAGRDPAASDAIDRLARLAGIRVIDFMSSVNIGRTAPYFGGYLAPSLQDVDLGLMVDIDVPWIPRFVGDNPTTHWAQIDVDLLKAASPMWTFPACSRIQGRSSRILTQLADELETLASSSFRVAAAKRCAMLTADAVKRQAEAAQLAAEHGEAGQIGLHYICAELGRGIDPEDIVVNEAVTKQMVLNVQIPRSKPSTMISNAGGGLGAAGGIALGIKLARPDRMIVQVVGDGTFYFTNPSAVLATSKQYHLPIFMVILDNGGWEAVKGSVLRMYPEGHAMQEDMFQSRLVEDIHLGKVGEAFGAYGETLTEPGEVPAAIARCVKAVREGRSAVLHARVTRH